MIDTGGQDTGTFGADTAGPPEDMPDIPGPADVAEAADPMDPGACAGDCRWLECGVDRCGNSCGTCGAAEDCVDGVCLPASARCPLGRCPVAAGRFWMGTNRDGTQCPANSLEPGHFNAFGLPCHEVDVPAFEIDLYETTQAAYRACVGAGVCTAPHDTFGGACRWGEVGREHHPVECVYPVEGQQYCNWIGRRLCSEAEWEYAARGTDGRVYPWGDGLPDCDLAIFDDSEGQGVRGCGAGTSWAVGSRPAGASPWGAMDMAGNVWEWVADSWSADYVGKPTDGSAWVEDVMDTVLRGGSYWFGAYDLPASLRVGYGGADYAIGFRCCR